MFSSWKGTECGMKEIELSIQDIKALMETFSRNKMGSFKLEQGDFSLKMEGPRVEHVAAAPVVTVSSAAAVPAPVEAETVSVHPGNEVKSPIVGTFYAAPAPDKDPFVKVGSKVKKGDVLFIIESMKLMNEVTSDFDGTVTDIIVQNSESVEYGQPILYIE